MGRQQLQAQDTISQAKGHTEQTVSSKTTYYSCIKHKSILLNICVSPRGIHKAWDIKQFNEKLLGAGTFTFLWTARCTRTQERSCSMRLYLLLACSFVMFFLLLFLSSSVNALSWSGSWFTLLICSYFGYIL